ncbi:MAG TPA: putative porin [Nitrospirota bacterium]|nr:putative porin [Nitrospirota bacterium]
MREINRLLASASQELMGKSFTVRIAVLLVLVTIGCAHPKPTTITHESTPSQSEAAMAPLKSRKGSVDQTKGTAPAQESHAATEAHQPEAAAPALVQSVTPSTEGTGTASIEKSRADQEAHEKELIEQITAQVTADVSKKVEEQVRSEVMNEMYREIWKVNQAMKEKDERLRFGGDIRLRYEADYFNSSNAILFQPSNPSQQMNTQNNTSRFKYRVRFGAEAKVNDQVEAVVRLSTGTTTNPVTENNTMGTYMNKGSVVFDLAYIKWQPWKALTLYGGRMPNPFLHSDLVWAPDLNFDGFVAKMKSPATESWAPFLTVGAFPLQQYDFSAHNKWLLGGQTGLERTNTKGISSKIGAAYYDYKNITGVPNSPDSNANNWTAPLFQQKGNTLFDLGGLNAPIYALASEFEEVNVTGILDIGFWDPVHIVFLGDYVYNVGFIRNDVIELTGNPNTVKDIQGEQFGITVGYPTIRDKKQWSVYFSFKRIGADAIVDAFTDPDFHLGGTNARGWIVGADFGLAKNFWLRTRWLTADQISGPPLAIDVLQVDFNARF